MASGSAQGSWERKEILLYSIVSRQSSRSGSGRAASLAIFAGSAVELSVESFFDLRCRNE